MRVPVQANSARRQVVNAPRTIPAPFKGWYTLESDTQMPVGAAKVLVNFWPEADIVSLRKGGPNHATELPVRVETLMAYRSGATEKLFAAASDGLYDVSAAGVVGTRVRLLTSARCSFTNYATSGGQYLITVNGSDAPTKYDGSNFTAIAVAGGGPANLNDLSFVWQYRARLYFLSKGSTVFYYLPADSIGGSLGSFDVGGSLTRGGSLVAAGRWTVDAGFGPDDLMVVVSDQGEVVVFNGRDPSDPNTWSLVGVFSIGKPVGDRCIINLGGDMAILCEDGLIPLSTVIRFDRAEQKKAMATSNIAKAFNEVLRQRGFGPEWGVFLWPAGSMLICNVPGTAGSTEQYVMNTQTGAWARFTGLPALCWEVYGDSVYYGTNDGRVVKFWHGSTDAGAPINAAMVLAFTYLGYSGVKSLSLMRSNLIASYAAMVSVGVAVDYDITLSQVVALDFGTISSQWDISPWDTTPWGDTDALRRQAWQGVSGVGYTFAPILTVTTLDRGPDFDLTLKAISFDLVAKNGGIL